MERDLLFRRFLGIGVDDEVWDHPVFSKNGVEPRVERQQAITLGADETYDAEDFVNDLRSMR